MSLTEKSDIYLMLLTTTNRVERFASATGNKSHIRADHKTEITFL